MKVTTTSSTVDLSGMPGFIEPINYDKIKNTDEAVKMFTVENGVFSCPVTTYYEMDSPYTWNRHRFVQPINLNWEYKEQQDSPENLIEQFLWNEDAVFSWMHDDIMNDLPNLPRFQIRRVDKITLIKGKSVESDRFLRTEYQISTEVVMGEAEIVEMIKSHPRYEKLVVRSKQIAEENEKIALQTEKQRKEHLVKNNYEMWKILNAKMEAGEFNEYMNK
jgi:hypothetical protein